MSYYHGKNTNWKHWFSVPKNTLTLLKGSTWGILFIAIGTIGFLKPFGWFNKKIHIAAAISVTTLAIVELLFKRYSIEQKKTVMLQVGSNNNATALDAVRISAQEKWLYDGSFKGQLLWSANLQNADLSRAMLQDVDFQNADLTNANLVGADLRGATLWMTNLSNVKLIYCNFEAADLMSANLQSSNLTVANLNYASLATADLKNAILHKAKMNHTDLRKAILCGVDFTDAKFQDVDITDAIYDDTTIWPRGFIPSVEPT